MSRVLCALSVAAFSLLLSACGTPTAPTLADAARDAERLRGEWTDAEGRFVFDFDGAEVFAWSAGADNAFGTDYLLPAPG